ncbi:MAG: hypothetical protein HYR60_20310 [Acidobacteria bacterium]|nr:hypothetical protein [Acidobacteriota bacterium]
MDRVIIAIGGTGQMVLHYYSQLFLTGLVRDPYHAYVFDTDEFSPSLRFLSEFFEQVGAAAGPAVKARIPTISLQTLKPQDKQGLVSEILAGCALPAQPGFHHPIQAFFSESDYKENVMQGLYGRPALSAVLALDESLECLNRIAPASVVAVVSSCIGGTGGGLTAPILWRLENRPGANLLLRAVLLGDFFKSSSREDNLKDQDNRFRSNRLFFLKAVQETLRNMQHYAFIEEPQMTRDKAAEQSARNLPWPDERSPYWQAASSVHALLAETVQETGGSVQAAAIPRETARDVLSRALARVSTFLGKSVLDRLAKEAFPVRVWGENLVRSISTYSRFEQVRASALAHDLQGEMGRAWAPVAAGEYGLSHVFPQIPASLTSVDAIVRCAWPSAPDDLDRASLGTAEGLRKRIARLLLFTLLRHGGQV